MATAATAWAEDLDCTRVLTGGNVSHQKALGLYFRMGPPEMGGTSPLLAVRDD